MEKIKYSIYKEENGNPTLDLKVKKEDGKYSIKEKVNNIKLKDLDKASIKKELKKLNLNEQTEAQIEKSIEQKEGVDFGTKKVKLENKYKDDETFIEKIEKELQKIEDRLETDFIELEYKMDDLYEK